MKEKFRKFCQFILNPKLLLCVLVAWLITNGWSYILFGFGIFFNIEWMIAAGGAYLAFLWLPVSPEKIATAAIAIWLLRLLFPDDQKTLGVLKDMYHKAKSTIKSKRKSNKE